MAITKENILIQVNKDTKRKLSDIDVPLFNILLDLSKRHAWLEAEEVGTLDVDAKASLPADHASNDYLHITADDATLTKISFGDYLNDILEGFAIRNKEIFATTGYANKAYTFYYGKNHDSDLSTIEFDDEFFDAIVAGVNYKVFREISMFPEAREWENIYENEISKLIDGTSDALEATEMKTRIRY